MAYSTKYAKAQASGVRRADARVSVGRARTVKVVAAIPDGAVLPERKLRVAGWSSHALAAWFGRVQNRARLTVVRPREHTGGLA
jgi:hypothetical protein